MQKAQPSRVFSGEKFRELRKERDLKASDIWRATGIPQRSLSAWTCGRRSPSSESLVLLSDALSCDINDFFVEVGR
ncbi:helix-turn-helix domain-containing protein [Streptomyces anulatus]|uniref:helix-turn-helix domain-containing protein n=1 Tax=Streptomyces anulatus TaxID=1892 RepID=UPI00339011E0